MKKLLLVLSSRNLRIGIIVVPLAISVLYLTFLASNRYVAESVIAVRQSGERPVNLDIFSSLFGASAPAQRGDESMLQAHILSMDMLTELDAKLGVRKHFSSPKLDWFFRLSPTASRERALDYYRDHVEVTIDDDSGLLYLRTQGFTPEFAETLNKELISASERFINESSHRLAREQMAFAESELHKARAKLEDAKGALMAFQKRHGVLDPMAQIVANSGLTTELQATLTHQEADMKNLLGYLNEDAYQVKALRSQIDATRAQLEVESRRAIGGGKHASLTALAGDYQELMGEVQFAQDTYKLALTGLETARIESTRKLKSLVLVESPGKPESALYPRRLYTLSALLIGLGLLYGIARLVVATIEDHQE